MSRSRFSIIVSLCMAAVSWALILPARAGRIACDFFASIWTDPRPFLTLNDGPALAFQLPGGDQISPSLYQRNRHEAGIARLGSVRHT